MLSIRKYWYVVIHAGNAHRDEFMGVGLLCHHIGYCPPVYRRKPSKTELAHPRIAVIDTGMNHDSKLSNWDHHQFPGGTRECALSLVARDLGYEKLLSPQKWYQVTVNYDSLGPLKTARELGLEKYPFELESPLESAILYHVKKGSINWQFLAKEIMGNLIEIAKDYEQQLNWLRMNAECFEIASIPILYTPTINPVASREYREEMAHQFKTPVAIQIYWDNTGDGAVLYRFDDDPRVDFSKLKGNENLKFVHSNGFIAKTNNRLSLEEILKLVEKSIVK